MKSATCQNRVDSSRLSRIDDHLLAKELLHRTKDRFGRLHTYTHIHVHTHTHTHHTHTHHTHTHTDKKAQNKCNFVEQSHERVASVHEASVHEINIFFYTHTHTHAHTGTHTQTHTCTSLPPLCTASRIIRTLSCSLSAKLRKGTCVYGVCMCVRVCLQACRVACVCLQARASVWLLCVRVCVVCACAYARMGIVCVC